LIGLTLNPSVDDWPHPKSLSRGERDFKTYFNSVLQTTPLLPREKGPGDEAMLAPICNWCHILRHRLRFAKSAPAKEETGVAPNCLEENLVQNEAGFSLRSK